MIYTHAPTDPLVLQQTIQARENQMLAMSQLLAELNEKLSKVSLIFGIENIDSLCNITFSYLF